MRLVRPSDFWNPRYWGLVLELSVSSPEWSSGGVRWDGLVIDEVESMEAESCLVYECVSVLCVDAIDVENTKKKRKGKK